MNNKTRSIVGFSSLFWILLHIPFFCANAVLTVNAFAVMKHYTCRRLTHADVPAMEKLIRSLEWGQTKQDLEFIVRNHNASWGYFDTSCQPARLVSMASLPQFATYSWLAYVATQEDHRRQGLATHLIEQVLQHQSVQSRSTDVPTIGLYGSVMGSPLYEQSFGFHDHGTAHLLSATIDTVQLNDTIRNSAGALPKGHTLVPLSHAIEEVVQSMDHHLYGSTGRPPVMDHADNAFAILENAQTLKGYVLARSMHPAGSANQSVGVFVGPVVACNTNEAQLLLHQAIKNALSHQQEQTRTSSTSIQVQMLLTKPFTKNSLQEQQQQEFRSATIAMGFSEVSQSRLMVRGSPDKIPWMRQWQTDSQSPEPKAFVAAGYEFG